LRVGLNARLTAGGPFLLRETGVLDRLEAVDLVVTGEGAIDAQTLHGKIVAALAREATRRGVPVVALGGQVTRSLEAPFPFLALSLYSSPMPMADAMRCGRLPRGSSWPRQTWVACFRSVHAFRCLNLKQSP